MAIAARYDKLKKNFESTVVMATRYLGCLGQCQQTLILLKATSPKSLPLDRRRWFAGNIIYDSVDATNFIDDAVGNLA